MGSRPFGLDLFYDSGEKGDTGRQQGIGKVVAGTVECGMIRAGSEAQQGSGERCGEMTEILGPREGSGRLYDGHTQC